MAAPPLNGLAVSSSGLALEHRAAPLFSTLDDVGGSLMGFDSRGVGLILALLLLAYWYRRVL